MVFIDQNVVFIATFSLSGQRVKKLVIKKLVITGTHDLFENIL